MKKNYYTVKQLADMLGVSSRTMQYNITKRNTWRTFLERNGYNGKIKEEFLLLFEINRETVNCHKSNAMKIKESKRYGKFGGFSNDSINVIERKRKEDELRQIEERIATLEDEMRNVVFDRDMNSQLQALYIKRRCVREWLGIKDNGIIDDCYL